LVFAFAVLVCPAIHSQAPVAAAPPAAQAAAAPHYEYAVATIKPDKTEGVQSYWRNTPDGFSAITPVIALMMSAYEVMPQQVIGLPGWATSEPLAIEAKMDGDTVAALAKLTPEEQWKAKDQMLQALLAERFALKLHRTTRELPIYALTLVDAGRLKKSATDSGGNASFYPGRIKAHAMSIDSLAMNLAGTLGRVVVNQTGLAGTYDFTLEWAPEGADASDQRPSIFTAIEEQMGLKLKATQGPVDAIVVDAIERPTAN
jgi:uncharacterized protein (TIGR03435 family)